MIIRKIEGGNKHQKQNVAAYARVSTDSIQQQTSFDTQVKHYTNLIHCNSDWNYIGVYADEGISGTSVKYRPQFQQMIEDAFDGKIDIILVKSISRFARNIVDAQQYVHELKSKNVEVRFEREGISSFDASSDMVFSLLASVAQEESRIISENIKWSYKKNAERGIRHLGNNRVLGYDEKDGVLVPNGDAWIIKQIFSDFANGLTLAQIEKNLRKNGAKGLHSKKYINANAVLRMLDNEIYVGDRLLQKSAPRNYLTKCVDTTVSYTSYYLSDDHEAIIDRTTWERVREIRNQQKECRANGINIRSNAHFLYGIVFCGECGAPYKRRTAVCQNGETYKYWNC
ncbi:MAG: recombinase family protein, partial [Clostridia bacterium]